MHEHVGEIARLNLVKDSVAVCEADTVVRLALGALLEHTLNNALANADAMVLTPTAVARFDQLLHEI